VVARLVSASDVDPRLRALLSEIKPTVIALVAIDDEGYLAVAGVADQPIPYAFDGCLLTLDLSVLVEPRPRARSRPPSRGRRSRGI